MKSKRRRIAGLLLAAAVLVGLYYADRWTEPRPAPPIVCGERCGKERWEVKTLSDPDSSAVNFSPQDTTVAWLVSLDAPRPLPPHGRVAPIETQVFQVTAFLIGVSEEEDRDFHIVIADLADPSKTMIVEIPSSVCSGACASSHVAEFEEARATVVGTLGEPSARFKRVSQRVVVTGVGFFDFLHGQTGVARNGIELHPVLRIEFLD